jgi:hypothetical protein
VADAELNALTALTSSTVADGDLLYLEDVSANIGAKTTLNDLTAYFESRARQHNSAVATQVTGAVDVYITNSNVVIPNNRLQAKTKLRWELAITKGAAGTGTPTFNIRVGTAGAIGDTSRCAFTWPAANTAAIDEMHVTITGTFRTVGSGTTAVIEGEVFASHEGTTTGFGGTGLGANIIINTTGGGFDSTVSNLFAGLSVNPGTAGAWSIRQCHAVIENLA